MAIFAHRHKYRAKPTEYNGLRYDSQAEARHAADLDLLVKAGEVRWWIRQPTFHLGTAEHTYRPDFLVVPASGEPYVVDVKGHETAKFRKDKELWKRYGPCRLVLVKGKRQEVVEPGEDA